MGRQGAKGRLRLCRSAAGDGWSTTPRCPVDLIPAERWWEPELRLEDLVEPTGKGVEKLKAIRDALLRESLQPVSLAVREVVATGGNVFRCQCFHAGVLSGPLLQVADLCKLYTVAPNLFIYIVLGYVFYKLSVLAANLKRNRRANDICSLHASKVFDTMPSFQEYSNLIYEGTTKQMSLLYPQDIKTRGQNPHQYEPTIFSAVLFLDPLPAQQATGFRYMCRHMGEGEDGFICAEHGGWVRHTSPSNK